MCSQFADMLKAVESHPAMLFYLDNQRSVDQLGGWTLRRQGTQ